MSACNVIHFDPHHYLLDTVLTFIEQPELFFRNERRSTELTLRAFAFAEDELKHAIIVLLGSAPRIDNTHHLYRIMHDTTQADEIRHEAAVQLGSILAVLDEPECMRDRLCADAQSTSPGRRAVAALALGWPDNTDAVSVLISLLYDPDRVVQKNAISALCSLRIPHLFPLLAEHLKHTDLDVKLHILLNLTHFHDRHEELVALYIRYAVHPDVSVRFDAFSLLSSIAPVDEYLDTCRTCLRDCDQRVRALALHQLAKAGTEAISSCKDDIRMLLAESDFEIRKAALKVLQEAWSINTVSP